MRASCDFDLFRGVRLTDPVWPWARKTWIRSSWPLDSNRKSRHTTRSARLRKSIPPNDVGNEVRNAPGKSD